MRGKGLFFNVTSDGLKTFRRAPKTSHCNTLGQLPWHITGCHVPVIGLDPKMTRSPVNVTMEAEYTVSQDRLLVIR